MRIYAIIPARGGSKELPGKNTRLLNGKPLIVWTIEVARAVPEISRVIVNTDDPDIAAVSKSAGAELFSRPKELAEDLTLDLPVFEHHLTELKKSRELPDMVVDLRATAPLRNASRIKQGIELLTRLGKEKADSVRAVSKASKHPYKMWKREGEFIVPFLQESITHMKEPWNAARQMLPEVFQNNGCVNAFWSDTILVKKSHTGDRIASFVMEDWESVNIDSELDFMIAEELMRRHIKDTNILIGTNETNSANEAANKKTELIYPELSFTVTGLCFAVHNALGPYAREKQYGDLFEEKLKGKYLPYKRELRIGTSGNVLDFVVDNKIALEFKAKRTLVKDDYYQVQRYLQESGLRLCLLVNFRNKDIKPVRIVRVDGVIRDGLH